jgi:hypothetical protein
LADNTPDLLLKLGMTLKAMFVLAVISIKVVPSVDTRLVWIFDTLSHVLQDLSSHTSPELELEIFLFPPNEFNKYNIGSGSWCFSKALEQIRVWSMLSSVDIFTKKKTYLVPKHGGQK